MNELHKAVAGDGATRSKAARAMRATLDSLTKQLAARNFRPDDLRAMIAGLADDGAAGQYRDYAGAEQATMAIGSLLNFLARREELKDARSANAALERLRKSSETTKNSGPSASSPRSANCAGR